MKNCEHYLYSAVRSLIILSCKLFIVLVKHSVIRKMIKFICHLHIIRSLNCDLGNSIKLLRNLKFCHCLIALIHLIKIS